MPSRTRYRIKEMFYTLQGEGAQGGRPAVFCRFSKCNLWNGRESGRQAAICQFCDTDFIGTDGQNGGLYTAEELIALAQQLWPGMDKGEPYIVCTGGEPLLQLDAPLIQQFHDAGFSIAIETNGTLPVPDGIDWICLSPKGAAEVVVEHCHELKLVYPQADAQPERFNSIQAEHRYLQPMDTAALIASDQIAAEHIPANTTRQTLEYCLAHPQWKLSLQTHKWIGID